MQLRAGRYLEASFLSVAELSREDLGVLKQRRARLPAAARFRDSHHRLARLFASGLTMDQVHERCGYSKSRLSVLRNDPAFEELVAEYRKNVNASWAAGADEYYGLAVSNMLEAELQLEEHLAKAREADEPLPVKYLISISRDAADRFGYGKKSSKDINLNVDFADRLQKAIQRSGKVIENSVGPQGPVGRNVGTGSGHPVVGTLSALPPIGSHARPHAGEHSAGLPNASLSRLGGAAANHASSPAAPPPLLRRA